MLAYLRVIAGFFAAMFTWMAIEGLVVGPASNAVGGIAVRPGAGRTGLPKTTRRRVVA